MEDQERYRNIARMRYEDGLTLQAIADIIGVSKQRISQILKEGGSLSAKLERGRKEHDKKWEEIRSGERARKIVELKYIHGLTGTAIGKRFGIKRARVSQIIKAQNNK